MLRCRVRGTHYAPGIGISRNFFARAKESSVPTKALRLLVVGTLRAPHWKTAAAHYLERIRHWRSVTERTIRDGEAGLPEAERIRREGRDMLHALKADDYLVCLDERGKSMSSPAFSAFLREISENAAFTPCFAIGGAFGLDETVRSRAGFMLSLGPMTLPHELARVVLLEQIYRAEAVTRNIPYHH
jgi:23S rRNA (pseudouridine1915-N3)-methyltransferase